MKKKVWGMYFSGTGTTKRIVTHLGKVLSDKFNADFEEYNFTFKKVRSLEKKFTKNDIVIFGVPVIAGRVPNVLLKYLDTIVGNGALAIPVVLYGNRNYDDALIELRDILKKDGFKPIAAGAFIGEHSFSKTLGKNRPDEKDLSLATKFADDIFNKISSTNFDCNELIEVNGTPYPYRYYYKPRDSKGVPVDIRKVKPLTNDKCINCGLCASICPMESINPENVTEITGICIKCCACVKECPVGAKYYDDENYLYHQHELEDQFMRRAEPELFI
ncbi:EFR1 family ferrodoxin [Fusobacterium sp. MFO224]|uniref:EFR1 family ferrodoxin n=1 Tax=Fusobacterium sp. MFO224 TaxID=3378070 RepID=UPI003854D301